MIDLLNKLFSRFNLQVVSKEEPHKEERCFLDDITSPEFIQKHPEFLDRYVEGQKNKSLYVGDINYLEDKNGVIELVEAIEETEHTIDHQRSLCLETLYKLGNRGDLKIGMFRAIENIIEHLEDVADAVELAGTSLEWLLIY